MTFFSVSKRSTNRVLPTTTEMDDRRAPPDVHTLSYEGEESRKVAADGDSAPCKSSCCTKTCADDIKPSLTLEAKLQSDTLMPCRRNIQSRSESRIVISQTNIANRDHTKYRIYQGGAQSTSGIIELPDQVVELMLSYLPTYALLRSVNCVRPLRRFIEGAHLLRCQYHGPELVLPSVRGEDMFRALVLADHVGTTSLAWQYKASARSTILRHCATGACIALCHDSVGWLRYQMRSGAQERICWSSGAWNPQDFSRDELLCRDSPEAWQPLMQLLRERTIGMVGRLWHFAAGSSPQSVELWNDYFSGKNCVHILDVHGASLRQYCAGDGWSQQSGERLGYSPDSTKSSSSDGISCLPAT